MGGLFGGGGGSIPTANVPNPPPSTMPISLADPSIWRMNEIQKQKAATAAGKGFAGTIKTSGQGTALPPLAAPSIVGGRL